MTPQELVDLRSKDLHTVTEQDLKKYPGMVSWFDPRLLFRLLRPVIISQVFGEYADRRLIVAALDKDDDAQLLDRADLRTTDTVDCVWVDYVSDLGDGFDATYAISYLIGQPKLKVNGHMLPRGSLLIMGGDEVYPFATTADYSLRMKHPYGFAFPVKDTSETPPIILAIAGNHDWYDGLSRFLSFFCSPDPKPIGGWSTKQRRSYFAARVTDKWWIWGIDISLNEDMDQPQEAYFKLIAEHMEGANLILCSSEPGWYNAEKGNKSYRSLGFAAWIAEKANKNIRIVLCLSGDTHHYARYSTESSTQFFTAGGGGAFLHGTHQLPKTLSIDWLTKKALKATLEHTKQAGEKTTTYQSCYPSKWKSRLLLFRNMLFPFLNPSFSLLFGAFYLVAFKIIENRTGPWSRLSIVSTLVLLLASYVYYQERSRTSWTKLIAVILAFLQGVVHFNAIIILTSEIKLIAYELQNISTNYWLITAIIDTTMFLTGSLIGGLIYGVFLIVGSGFANITHNDAFSAMRLTRYKHFLRIKIEGDKLTVFPISLDRIPARSQWRKPDALALTAGQSIFQPTYELVPQLIEDPITIDANEVR